MFSVSYNFGNMVEAADRFRVISNINCVDLNEEKQLVESAKVNIGSFSRLYDHYFPKVYAFVAAKICDRADTEDLVGDIFMKALENLHGFEWRGVPFGAWIFRIARNTLNDYFGKSAKTRTADIEKVYGISEDQEKTSPHVKASREELSEKVKEVLKTLPERDLNVIQLKFFSEMSNREITQITGLSESNVAVIIYRTLKKIKPDLKYFA